MALELTFGSDEWCDDVINSSGRVALVANATSKVVFCDGAAVHAEAAARAAPDGLAEKARRPSSPTTSRARSAPWRAGACSASLTNDDLGAFCFEDKVVVKSSTAPATPSRSTPRASAAWDPGPNRLAAPARPCA
ncbi:hypothetical protein JL720_16847 [Aureococcus anophagefferens]|nr:hypothetical protein JL720_16847 [Aureococcus anophagefferens]